MALTNVFGFHKTEGMGKLLGLIGAVFGSWVGWWIGSYVGVTTAYFLSVIGMGVGLFAAKRFLQNLFD